MTPALQMGDFVMTDAWQYIDQLPGNGDIVVYEDVTAANTKYTKRIVGVPGDEIEIRDGALFRNGQTAVEPYLVSSLSAGPDVTPITLPPGQHYLLGDNCGNSRDSRFHGPVDVDHILGRVEYIWFSSASWKRFPSRVSLSRDEHQVPVLPVY